MEDPNRYGDEDYDFDQIEEDLRPHLIHHSSKFYECPRCGSLDLKFGEERKKPKVSCNACDMTIYLKQKRSGGIKDEDFSSWVTIAKLWNRSKEDRIAYAIPLLEERYGNAYIGHITLDVWGDKLKPYLEEIVGKEVFFKPPELDATDEGMIIETYRRTGNEYETLEEAEKHRMKGTKSKVFNY